MRRLGLVLLLVAVGVPAYGQSAKSDTCVPNVADVYRFTATPRLSQHEFRLYAERNNPGMFMLLVDSDGDTVGLSAGNDRFLHLSVGLISGRHQLLVACVRRADYSVGRVNGNERALARGGTLRYGRPADLRQKTAAPNLDIPINVEINLQRGMAELAAALTPNDP
jgi:hypothetical protein